MATLQKTTVKEQVYSLLKNQILTQQYELGEHINIDSLAVRLGVSNSPIREAINMLKTEGLVTVSPNAGASVVSLSLEDMHELAQAICVMLVGAYDHCVRYGLTDSLAPRMGQALERQHCQLKKRDLYEFVRCANDFDRCILTAAGNARLLASLDNIFSLFLLTALYDYQHRDTDWSLNIAEHRKILAAVTEKRHQDVIDLIHVHYNKPVFNGD